MGGKGLHTGQTPPSPLDNSLALSSPTTFGDGAVQIEGDVNQSTINTGTINNISIGGANSGTIITGDGNTVHQTTTKGD